MAKQFTMPDLGENIEQADIGHLLVAEGDVIEAEQAVLELETEKAVLSCPVPSVAKVVKVHVAEGDTVAIGSPILTIEESSSGGTSESPTDAPAEDTESEAGDATAAAAAATAEPPEACAETRSTQTGRGSTGGQFWLASKGSQRG